MIIEVVDPVESQDGMSDYLPSREAVRGWVAPFENTGISDTHLYHIVAGQAAAYAALRVISSGNVEVSYRPSVEQVEGWVSSLKEEILNEEQIFQYVADRATCWVTSQI